MAERSEGSAEAAAAIRLDGAIVDHLPDGIALVDAGGVVHWAAAWPVRAPARMRTRSRMSSQRENALGGTVIAPNRAPTCSKVYGALPAGLG